MSLTLRGKKSTQLLSVGVTQMSAIDLQKAAHQRSLEIDQALAQERSLLKKAPPVKVLVLGQGESGKSTIVKNFQLKFAYQAWSKERGSWRAVIQLNLIRSVNQIVDLLIDRPPSSDIPNITFNESSSSSSPTIRTNFQSNGIGLTPEHKLLIARLLPLRKIQGDLEVMLGLDTTPLKDSLYESNNGGTLTYSQTAVAEPTARSNSGWKSVLGRIQEGKENDNRASIDSQKRNSIVNPQTAGKRMILRWRNKVSEVLSDCKGDINALWQDEYVREFLKAKGIRIEQTPGFFLGDVDRIASPDYEPSDDDIVRARLRTTGVQEYQLTLPKNNWILYDVAGARTSRASWIPFFDSINTIIFLAPISCFDETLSEAPDTNRIEDSLGLWKSINQNKLLEGVQFILLLNKCDLLEEKLRRGIKFGDWVKDFGKRKNEKKVVCSYFYDLFEQIMRKYSKLRPFYCHLTSAIDTKAMSITLDGIKEGILTNQLKHIGML